MSDVTLLNIDISVLFLFKSNVREYDILLLNSFIIRLLDYVIID